MSFDCVERAYRCWRSWLKHALWSRMALFNSIQLRLLFLQIRILRYCYQGSHASWKVLHFFLKIPGSGKSWKITFGPGKSWKLELKVLKSAGKILKVMHFSSGSNETQAAIVSTDHSHKYSVECWWILPLPAFHFYCSWRVNAVFSLSRVGSEQELENFACGLWILESPGKNLDFFVSKRMGTLYYWVDVTAWFPSYLLLVHATVMWS